MLILLIVLIDVTRALRDAGLSARGLSSDDKDTDALLEVGDGERQWIFAVETRRRAPYPNEVPDLESLRLLLQTRGEPLLIAPFITEGTGERLAEAGWSWADLEGNLHLRAPGLLAHQRRPRQTRQAPSKRLPQGSGGLGIIRALIGFVEGEAEPLDATGLATQAGVTQPRASQVLGRLRDLNLVSKRDGYWWPDREALLDRFLTEYRGPGGSEHFFYSLKEPSDVAIDATSSTGYPYRVVVSGDVAADLMASWMRPRLVVLYAREELSLRELKLTEAVGRDDANVVIRFPDDTSVFPRRDLAAAIRTDQVPLADPTQIIWDLDNLGGADRLEAAGAVRKWLLNR